ncbi:ATP-grasp domain-containing protein [Salsipaludibacter albus]|uniref:ATP-grasp domain-containing protein n=1 Tax=Salsipaludibacter albus TaxID=2849650 RepID=UPI0023679B75|nr:ATP-grasp domain-containing protein [Salsipaludibacter albus]MBY5161956.1 ATP-grasp domain-containing protein [Salsipaludibacter albus]
MSPRLMVLGGGRHQVSLVRRARARGIDVVLVDYYDHPPARDLVDTHLRLSTLDVDAVVDAARAHHVDGVVTTGTDLPVVTMAAVAEALGLPAWIDRAHAARATTKSLMQRALAATGVPMADQQVLGPDDEPGHVALPVVVKPADSQGQRGVTRVDDRIDLDGAIADARSHSRAGTVVVERFLDGPEITANAWVEDDGIVLLAVNDRVTVNPSPHLGIAHRHVHPTRHASPDLFARLDDLLDRIATAYGMRTGPLYVQLILTSRGPVVVEAAARVGGGHETSLFPLVAGSGVEDRLVDLALTGSCEPWDHDMRTAAELRSAGVTFVLGWPGTVATLAPMDFVEGTVEGGWYVDVGDRLVDLTTSLGRIGWFVSTAADRAELDRRTADQYARLEVRAADGASLVRQPEPGLLLG